MHTCVQSITLSAVTGYRKDGGEFCEKLIKSVEPNVSCDEVIETLFQEKRQNHISMGNYTGKERK